MCTVHRTPLTTSVFTPPPFPPQKKNTPKKKGIAQTPARPSSTVLLISKSEKHTRSVVQNGALLNLLLRHPGRVDFPVCVCARDVYVRQNFLCVREQGGYVLKNFLCARKQVYRQYVRI